MPRTLPSALTTAMDSGSFEAYLRVNFGSEPTVASQTSKQPIAFTLRPLSASVTFEYTSGTINYFQLERGAVVNGTPVTIKSIWFKVVEFKYLEGRFITLEGEPLERTYNSTDPGVSYDTLLDATLENGYTSLSKAYEGSAAWKNYQFYADGKSPVTRQRKQIFPLLQQKQLAFATEAGQTGTSNTIYFFRATDSRDVDYSITDLRFNYNAHQESRRQVWLDETGAARASGSVSDSIHNLGYLESTDAPPPNQPNLYIGSRSSKLQVHLKRLTGDKVTFNINQGISITTRVKVTEVFDQKSIPSWYQVLETLEWYPPTEGGSLANIEAAPYTPVHTGNFTGVLSANDNNLQTALETLDAGGGGGDWTLVEDKLLGADTASFDFTSIPATYKHLKIILTVRSDRADISDKVNLQINGDTTAGNYFSMIYALYHNAQVFSEEFLGTTQPVPVGYALATNSPASGFAEYEYTFNDYANTSKLKDFQCRGGGRFTTGTGNLQMFDGIGQWASTSAITRIKLTPNFGTNWKQHSRATLYGIV
jgi:hypothetical protein